MVRLVPTWSTAEEATCLDKAHTPQTAVKNSAYHSLTHDIIKEAEGRLRGLPSGDPCRPGCMEAGWLLEGERTRVSCKDIGLAMQVGRQARRKGP